MQCWKQKQHSAVEYGVTTGEGPNKADWEPIAGWSGGRRTPSSPSYSSRYGTRNPTARMCDFRQYHGHKVEGTTNNGSRYTHESHMGRLTANLLMSVEKPEASGRNWTITLERYIATYTFDKQDYYTYVTSIQLCIHLVLMWDTTATNDLFSSIG